MPGIEEAQMQRLEKESERFTNEIKQKEIENEMLLEQIATLQCQIEQSNNLLREVTKVSDEASLFHGGISLRSMQMWHGE
jgi:hypothetical protein